MKLLKTLLPVLLILLVVEAKSGGGSHSSSHNSSSRSSSRYIGYGRLNSNYRYGYSSVYHSRCDMDIRTGECHRATTNIGPMIFWILFALCCCGCGV